MLIEGKTYKFRAGDRVGLCPPLWHMDKTIYSNPTHFDPSRWLLPGWEDCNRQYSEDTVMAAQGKTKLFKDGTALPRYRFFVPYSTIQYNIITQYMSLLYILMIYLI